jgi:hypothetical protein
MDVPLPWERLIWSGRPALAARLAPAVRPLRYVLTDVRLVVSSGAGAEEILIHDIGDVEQTRGVLDRLSGTSTLRVHARDGWRKPLVLHGIRRASQLAALLEILSGDPLAVMDPDSARAALEWTPRLESTRRRTAALEAASAVVVLALATAGGVTLLRHRTFDTVYAADDAIYPSGVKRSEDAIVEMMKREVMPWARETLAPIVGGADRVTCATCHGRDAERRGWRMPAVPALPEPDVRRRGWERYSGSMDEQMRNAIYGYAAEPEKQGRATYMRDVVLPGMAKLLHRPAYDFTQPYEYNRSRNAFGCYHCHRVR